MTELRTRFLAAAGAVAAAGTLAVAGLTAATASTSAGAARSGTEHFQLMSTSATSNAESIIATGVFTAGGVDHAGNKVDRAVFPQGTFRIRHSAGTGSQRFNPRTCLGQISLQGTYRLFDGTGKFAGIRGHGRYRLSILFVAARAHGKCVQNKPPASFQLIIRARGPVRL